MAKSQQSFNKSEKEKKRLQKRNEKAEKAEERKANKSDSSLDNMMAYVDENGNISSTPPDPSKKIIVKAEDIEIGVPKREKEVVEDTNYTGKVDYFNHQKGFGFILDAVTGEKYFVHIQGCVDKIDERDLVSFELEKGMKGLNAVNVKKI